MGVLDLASANLAASIFCCLNTEDLVGAGPLLILPLPVVFLTKCVSGVSLKRNEFHYCFPIILCIQSFKELQKWLRYQKYDIFYRCALISGVLVHG